MTKVLILTITFGFTLIALIPFANIVNSTIANNTTDQYAYAMGVETDFDEEDRSKKRKNYFTIIQRSN